MSIINSRQWRAITGELPPTSPPTAAQYAEAGLPWFDYYSELEAVEATDKFKGVAIVAALGTQRAKHRYLRTRRIDAGPLVSQISHCSTACNTAASTRVPVRTLGMTRVSS